MIRQCFLMMIIEIFTLLRCIVLAAVTYFLKLIRITNVRYIVSRRFSRIPVYPSYNMKISIYALAF